LLLLVFFALHLWLQQYQFACMNASQRSSFFLLVLSVSRATSAPSIASSIAVHASTDARFRSLYVLLLGTMSLTLFRAFTSTTCFVSSAPRCWM
jgi:hypothetical protein